MVPRGGQYDEAALGLADRMLQSGRKLSHQQLDTVALAKFRNGQIQEAIDLQRTAISKSNSKDYRNRLAQYEAALQKAQSEQKRKVIND